LAERRIDAAAQYEFAGLRVFDSLRSHLAQTRDDKESMAMLESIALLTRTTHEVPLDCGLSVEADLLVARAEFAEHLQRHGAALPHPVYEAVVDFIASIAFMEIASDRALPNGKAGSAGIATSMRIPTPQLYQLREMLLPAERMAVGAVRRQGAVYHVETMYDVTEPNPTATHVNGDPDKLTAAFLQMEITKSFFGIWMHSQPGNAESATLPSQEDCATYSRRLASGDSQNLIGGIIAGNYLRFFGATGRIKIELVGEGVRELKRKGESIYVYDH
jgi:hypothetical protein